MTERELLSRHIKEMRKVLNDGLDMVSTDKIREFKALRNAQATLIERIKNANKSMETTLEYVNLAKRIDPQALEDHRLRCCRYGMCFMRNGDEDSGGS